MIKVEKLTKRYGGVTAVDEINFEVGQGRGCRISRSKRRRKEHHDANARVLPSSDLWARRSGWLRRF